MTFHDNLPTDHVICHLVVATLLEVDGSGLGVRTTVVVSDLVDTWVEYFFPGGIKYLTSIHRYIIHICCTTKLFKGVIYLNWINI